MTTQPEALRLADALTPPKRPDWVMHIPTPWHPPSQEVSKAAAELRRLHEENQRLLGALQELLGCDKTRTSFGALMRARDAIAEASGDTA